MVDQSWQPANPTEFALLSAAGTGDEQAFLAALSGSYLYLPLSEDAAEGRETPRWATGELEGITFLVAFTSPEAIAAGLPGTDVRYRISRFLDVVGAWPDPAWRLALNPRLPIAAQLSSDVLRAMLSMAPERIRPADLTPTEEVLWTALQERDSGTFMATLVRQTLLLPLAPDGGESRDLTDPEFPWWCVSDEAGMPSVAVFTSDNLLRQVLGDHDAIEVGALQLIEVWPDPAWMLAVNPNTGLATTLSGEQTRALGTWVGEMREAADEDWADYRERQLEAELQRLTGTDPNSPLAGQTWDTDDDEALDIEAPDLEDPDPPVPLTLQLVIPHAYLNAYLEQGYHRAAGLVHSWRGPGRETPTSLYQRLGLLGDGSPFTTHDEWIAVLRWLPDEQTPEHWGRGEPSMESVLVPDGAQIHRIRADRTEEPVARFDAATGRWLPVDRP